MRRGSQKIYLHLFADLEPPVMPTHLCKPGRSADKITQRNERLLHRYYWHGRRQLEPGKRMSYSSLLDTLEMEFDLSKIRIVAIIDECYTDLALIKQQYKDDTDAQVARAFAKRWGWLVW